MKIVTTTDDLQVSARKFFERFAGQVMAVAAQNGDAKANEAAEKLISLGAECCLMAVYPVPRKTALETARAIIGTGQHPEPRYFGMFADLTGWEFPATESVLHAKQLELAVA